MRSRVAKVNSLMKGEEMIRTPLQLKLFLKGIRQVDVARSAGVDRSFVCRVVNGRQKPSPKVLMALKEHGIEVEVTHDGSGR